MRTEKSLPVPRFALTPNDQTPLRNVPVFRELLLSIETTAHRSELRRRRPRHARCLADARADAGSRNFAGSRQAAITLQAPSPFRRRSTLVPSPSISPRSRRVPCGCGCNAASCCGGSSRRPSAGPLRRGNKRLTAAAETGGGRTPLNDSACPFSPCPTQAAASSPCGRGRLGAEEAHDRVDGFFAHQAVSRELAAGDVPPAGVTHRDLVTPRDVRRVAVLVGHQRPQPDQVLMRSLGVSFAAGKPSLTTCRMYAMSSASQEGFSSGPR